MCSPIEKCNNYNGTCSLSKRASLCDVLYLTEKNKKPDVVAHSCNPGTQAAEAGEFEYQASLASVAKDPVLR